MLWLAFMFDVWGCNDLYVLVYSWRLSVSVVLDTGLNSSSFAQKVWMIPLHNRFVWLHWLMDHGTCTEKPWWNSGEDHHPFYSGVLYVKRKVGACSYVDDPIGSQSLLSRAMHKVYIIFRNSFLPSRCIMLFSRRFHFNCRWVPWLNQNSVFQPLNALMQSQWISWLAPFPQIQAWLLSPNSFVTHPGVTGKFATFITIYDFRFCYFYPFGYKYLYSVY